MHTVDFTWYPDCEVGECQVFLCPFRREQGPDLRHEVLVTVRDRFKLWAEWLSNCTTYYAGPSFTQLVRRPSGGQMLPMVEKNSCFPHTDWSSGHKKENPSNVGLREEEKGYFAPYSLLPVLVPQQIKLFSLKFQAMGRSSPCSGQLTMAQQHTSHLFLCLLLRQQTI